MQRQVYVRPVGLFPAPAEDGEENVFVGLPLAGCRVYTSDAADELPAGDLRRPLVPSTHIVALISLMLW